MEGAADADDTDEGMFVVDLRLEDMIEISNVLKKADDTFDLQLLAEL